MTVEEKISELNRRLSGIDSLTVDSLEELKSRPRTTTSRDELNKSAAKIRESVMRYSRELESRS